MLQALLGPSGAGKSTLMDILAQRKTVGYLSGFLLVNGQPANDTFVRKTAYVPQVCALPQATRSSVPASAHRVRVTLAYPLLLHAVC